MRELVDFIRSEKDYAIIFAMRQRHKFPPDMFDGLEKHPNVFFTEWIPQRGVLSHPKVKVFLNHGGQGSFSDGVETLTSMLVYPISPSDQHFSCEQVQI